MNPATIIAMIEGLITVAVKLFQVGRQLYGTEAIPSLEKILAKNTELQEKIDAEKT
jgi:hypothetical protein